MSVEVTQLGIDDGDEWNDHVEASPAATPFHRFEALTLLAGETGTTLRPLVGHKGQEPVGVLPLFESAQGPLTEVRSPPAHEIFNLGPAPRNLAKLKQRKRERRHREFLESCIDWIEGTLEPDYVDVRTTPNYPDVRPFTWRGFDVSAAYTYEVELEEDADEMLMRFSRDARSNVEDARESDLEIEDVDGEAGAEAVEWIIQRIRERHEDQEKTYPISVSFARQLYERLPEGVVRPYVARVDGQRVGGMVSLAFGDTVYRWQGGATPDADVDVQVNDALDWHIMRDAWDRGYERYDLVGANNPRLCRYKSKFDPTPTPYYVATKETTRMRLARGAFHLVPEALRGAL